MLLTMHQDAVQLHLLCWTMNMGNNGRHIGHGMSAMVLMNALQRLSSFVQLCQHLLSTCAE